jgi:hypothetical protein
MQLIQPPGVGPNTWCIQIAPSEPGKRLNLLYDGNGTMVQFPSREQAQAFLDSFAVSAQAVVEQVYAARAKAKAANRA